ncbi:hypothetical protein QBC34DRAFT_31665 [Podospora aff. communis PSN243]|uniref:Uncharacterized protein n=1 Tax=Podospora aff. communis PSN243 TaxID=3040156 RepID=A0AAV9GUF5_9PEZI|nr:hypothetical protein QBC34DRAFT_31665 [Podospora aff. communis PSN243]
MPSCLFPFQAHAPAHFQPASCFGNEVPVCRLADTDASRFLCSAVLALGRWVAARGSGCEIYYREVLSWRNCRRHPHRERASSGPSFVPRGLLLRTTRWRVGCDLTSAIVTCQVPSRLHTVHEKKKAVQLRRRRGVLNDPARYCPRWDSVAVGVCLHGACHLIRVLLRWANPRRSGREKTKWMTVSMEIMVPKGRHLHLWTMAAANSRRLDASTMVGLVTAHIACSAFRYPGLVRGGFRGDPVRGAGAPSLVRIDVLTKPPENGQRLTHFPLNLVSNVRNHGGRRCRLASVD